jgi:hypothetical protein
MAVSWGSPQGRDWMLTWSDGSLRFEKVLEMTSAYVDSHSGFRTVGRPAAAGAVYGRSSVREAVLGQVSKLYQSMREPR